MEFVGGEFCGPGELVGGEGFVEGRVVDEGLVCAYDESVAGPFVLFGGR